MLEEIERGEMKFASVEDFLIELKRKFGKGNNKLAKVAEVKK